MRGLLVGVIVTLLSLFFTTLKVHDLSITVGVVVLTAMLFSLCGFINAVYADNFDDISVIPTFVLTPLIYLAHYLIDQYLGDDADRLKEAASEDRGHW